MTGKENTTGKKHMYVPGVGILIKTDDSQKPGERSELRCDVCVRGGDGDKWVEIRRSH